MTWVTVSGAAFTPEDDDCFDYDHDNYSGVIEDDDGCVYVADVALPHGSTVTGVWAFFDANSESAELHLEENDSQGSHTDIAEVNLDNCETGPNDCAATDFHLDSPNVDNAHRSYGIWMRVNSCCSFELHRVAIRLGVPAAGAAVATTPFGPAINKPSSHVADEE